MQGVGFRPFVHSLATDLGLAGEVRNSAAGVEVHLEGRTEALKAFLARVVDDAPPLALIEDLTSTPAARQGRIGFHIGASERGRVDTLVTADAATCDDCLRELFSPADRRHRYPFINCTNCGPRFTITRSVPYDRPSTTMAPFVMCPQCDAEYHDPSDRRFHAQPNACPACGPRLGYHSAGDGKEPSWGEDALGAAVRLLQAGGVLAVKGLGGFHLACDATDEEAVRTLRRRKHRDLKPFAVMVASPEAAVAYCSLSESERALLASSRRPVVLLDRLDGHGHSLSGGVAPDVTTYGLFLPYTPLHHLLLHDVGRPLVMTSGNLSDEPIAFEETDADLRLSPLADGFLTHDRAIHVRTDDSVARVFRSQPYLLRRARGYVPLPVAFSGSDTQILAVGGHLKNTFCLTRGSRAFISHHIGDLENVETLRSLRDGVTHFEGLFGLSPAAVAHDLHPDYLSSRFARDYAAAHDLLLVGVQHHEAHVASVLADAHHPGPVIGVAYDGAGYGPDGTIWGGEMFAGVPGSFERVARLEHLPLPGADAAVKEPWRLALGAVASCLDALRPACDPAAGDDELLAVLAGLPLGRDILERPWELVLRAARRGINTPWTSSAGRLFDAVSALLGLCHLAAYEGRAAVLLETAARQAFRGGLPAADSEPDWGGAARLEGCFATVGRRSCPDPAATAIGAPPREPVVLPVLPLIRRALGDVAAGVAPAAIASRFHHALAWLTADAAARLAQQRGLGTVALAGGVFQNMVLLELVVRRLEAAGLQVLVHRNVPTNDGGLCLGQAESAAALLRARTQGAP